MHSISVNHIFKGYYSASNSNINRFFEHDELGLIRVHMSSPHTQSFKNSQNPKSQEFKCGEHGAQLVGKLLKLPYHLHNGHEAVPFLLGQCEVVHQLA